MVLALAIALAVVGALFIAVGSVLQERVVVHTRLSGGQIRFLLRLLSESRWLWGGVLAGIGVVLHVVALSHGPVSIIQPVGTAGLLFAVVTKALLDRRPVSARELIGSVAIIAGLAGLLTALPHAPKDHRLPDGTALLLGLAALAATGFVVLVGWWVTTGSAKAVALALAAGGAFGVGSALIGLIGHRTVQNPAAVLDWPTLVVVPILVLGGLSQQHAYRMRRFALVFALLEVSDPVTASSVGVLVLGEPMPDTIVKAAQMGASAFVIVLGVVVLAHSYTALTSAEKNAP